MSRRSARAPPPDLPDCVLCACPAGLRLLWGPVKEFPRDPSGEGSWFMEVKLLAGETWRLSLGRADTTLYPARQADTSCE